MVLKLMPSLMWLLARMVIHLGGQLAITMMPLLRGILLFALKQTLLLMDHLLKLLQLNLFLKLPL